MTGGFLFSTAFFLLVSFAALTSAVSILEVVVAYCEEKRGLPRKKSTLISGALIYLLGLLTVFSTNIMSEVKILGMTFFDLFDKLTSSYFLPLGGLFISLFVGWIIGPQAVTRMLGTSYSSPAISQKLEGLLLWSLRLFAPAAVIAILLQKIL